MFGHVELAQEAERRRPWSLMLRSDIDPEVAHVRRLAMLREQYDFANIERACLQRARQNRAPGVAVVAINGRSAPAATGYNCAVPGC